MYIGKANGNGPWHLAERKDDSRFICGIINRGADRPLHWSRSDGTNECTRLDHPCKKCAYVYGYELLTGDVCPDDPRKIRI